MTPDQIEAASFTTVKRGGYRTEEVDRFLRMISQEMRVLDGRVRAAEGANEDLQAASAEMATLLRDVHAQLGERRRAADAEAEQMRRDAEERAAAILTEASDRAESVRHQAERVLADAQRHAELLRNDGEQRVREQAADILRAARAELQELLRRKHEILHAVSALRADLTGIETGLEASALSPDALSDDLVERNLIDLREAERSRPSAPTASLDTPAAHPSAGGSFVPPPEPPAPPT